MSGFNTLHFEVSEDAGGGIPGGGLTPEGLTDQIPEPPAPEPAVDVAQQIEEMQALIAQQQEELQQLAPVREYMTNVPGPAGQQQGPPLPPDPYTSENFQQEMAQYVTQITEAATAPYRDLEQQQRTAMAIETAHDIIADIEAEHGELITPKYAEGQEGPTGHDLAIQFAVQAEREFEQRYGPGPRAEEAAFQHGYEKAKAYNAAIVAAENERAQNQLSTLSRAPREPGSSGIASQQAVTTQPGGWEAFEQRWGQS